MVEIRKTITATIHESPYQNIIAPAMNGGNGPIVLDVPVGWIAGDDVKKYSRTT
jgi:hypothetical protein